MKNPSQLIYGIHAISYMLQSVPDRILSIYLCKGKNQNPRCQELVKLAVNQRITVQDLNKKKLDEWCNNAAHQGVAAIIKYSELLTEEKLFSIVKKQFEHQQPPSLLILDSVQDPRNLGAILRTADAAGVTAVVTSKDRSVSITAAVRKVASGAVDTVPLVSVTNLARTLYALQELGIWIVGMDNIAEANSLYATDLTGAKAIVLGGEGKGLRSLTRKHCDFIAAIPMLGSIESLNVSVAAGICLFEAIRQRITIH